MWILRVFTMMAVLNTHISTGENISTKKLSKQSSTFKSGNTYYSASRALGTGTVHYGSMTNHESPSWWQLDLMGFYTIHNITITAPLIHSWAEQHMPGAWVEVMDKDISLCPDEAQVTSCGNIPSTVNEGEMFTFFCQPTFHVRFVRVSRGPNLRIGLGHVDVQGEGATKNYRAYYTQTQDKKVTHVLQTVGAAMAAECGIFCHQRHDCLHFSYSKTAPSDANCLMTNYPVPGNTAVDVDWVLHTLDACK